MRSVIKEYLKISDRYETAAQEALKNDELSVKEIAANNELGYTYLCFKIDTIRHKILYNEEKLKFETGVREVLATYSIYYDVAVYYGIPSNKLGREVKRARIEGLENYKYDKKVNNSRRALTYLDEKSLFDDLINWKKNEQQACHCQLCALEKLSTLAYEFVKDKKLKYPLAYWIGLNRADNDWLCQFEMRHHDEIINTFVSYKYCSKETA